MSSEKVTPDGYKQAGVHIASAGGRVGQNRQTGDEGAPVCHKSVTNYIEFVLLQHLEGNALDSERQKTPPSRTR